MDNRQHDNDGEKIELAYDDKKGVTRDFIMNGLKVAGRTLGDEDLFSDDKWEYFGQYNTELREYTRAIGQDYISYQYIRSPRGLLQVQGEADGR